MNSANNSPIPETVCSPTAFTVLYYDDLKIFDETFKPGTFTIDPAASLRGSILGNAAQLAPHLQHHLAVWSNTVGDNLDIAQITAQFALLKQQKSMDLGLGFYMCAEEGKSLLGPQVYITIPNKGPILWIATLSRNHEDCCRGIHNYGILKRFD